MGESSSGTVVRVIGLHKWYGSYHVVRGAHLSVTKGECVVLWGPSGSGKTTLLRCIAGLEPAQSGLLEIAGSRKPVGPLVPAVPTPGVGMVFQRSALFRNLRVIDNLTIGLCRVRKMATRAAQALALEHLTKLRVADLAMRYPAQLSGGQQQRVEIARTMCMDPAVILFDEPTAALDPELKHEVGEAIAGLAREGRTVMVATHEPVLIRALQPRMVLMADGTTIGESTYASHFEQHA